MSRDPHDGAWHDAQYDNRARVADSAAYLERWAQRSAGWNQVENGVSAAAGWVGNKLRAGAGAIGGLFGF